MRVIYNNTFKIAKKDFSQLQSDVCEAILFIDRIELAQVKVDRIKGTKDIYGITIFIPMKKEILSIHGEGSSLREAMSSVYQEVLNYKKNGYILMNRQFEMFAA